MVLRQIGLFTDSGATIQEAFDQTPPPRESLVLSDLDERCWARLVLVARESTHCPGHYWQLEQFGDRQKFAALEYRVFNHRPTELDQIIELLRTSLLPVAIKVMVEVKE